MAEKDKLSPEDRADIFILRGLGYTTKEIAEKLGVTEPTVSYHISRFRERAEKVSPKWAFMEIILQAGPLYLTPIHDLIKFRREE